LGSWHVSKNNKKVASNPEKHQTYSLHCCIYTNALLATASKVNLQKHH
jgi:hypothetical protein